MTKANIWFDIPKLNAIMQLFNFQLDSAHEISRDKNFPTAFSSTYFFQQ